MILLNQQKVKSKNLQDQDTNSKIDYKVKKEKQPYVQALRTQIIYSEKQVGISLPLLVDAAIGILRNKSLVHFHSIYKNLIHSIRQTNWSEQIQQSKIQTLINLIQIKVSIIGESFYVLFDGLKDLLQRMKLKLKIKLNLVELISKEREKIKNQNSRGPAERKIKQIQSNIHNILSYRQTLQDRYLQKILAIIEENKNRQSDQILKQNYFKQLISQTQFQLAKTSWIQFFQRLQVYQKMIKSQKSRQQINTLENIENERLMNLSCFGCTSFMYQNAIIKTDDTKLVATFPSIHKLKNYQTEVKEKINQFMNCGGGVILFNCHPQLFNIRIKGAIISEKQKEAFEQILIGYLPSFYPRLKLNQNIFISFIPLVQTSKNQKFLFREYQGGEALLKQGQKYIKRQYLQGHFVCRIVVRPSKNRKTTFWIQNQGMYQKHFLNVKTNGQREQPMKHLRKYIKENLKRNQIYRSLNELQRQWRFINSYFDDHQCSNPERGIKITNLNKFKQLNQPKSRSQLQEQYDYMSILIARSKHLPQIKQKLKRYGNKVFMDKPFANYKFKHASHSSILHHNIKFQTLLKEVCFNKQFVFEGKSLMTINVTTYLKFKKRNQSNMLISEYIQQIRDWLHKQFPEEKLKLWQFVTEQNTKEYYLQTDSKLSTLFVYYVLWQNGEQVVFKCPLGLDKMSIQDRRLRFKQIEPIEPLFQSLEFNLKQIRNQQQSFNLKKLGNQYQDTCCQQRTIGKKIFEFAELRSPLIILI